MKGEELLLGSELRPCSARTGRAALLHLATACLCWETTSVCGQRRRRNINQQRSLQEVR